jgi:hypothetical protein
MPRMDLRAETLYTLDGGRAGGIINAAINAAVADTDDRGEDGKPRKVVITLTTEKLDNGTIAVSLEAKSQVPVYRASTTFAKPRMEGRKAILVFQQDAPENPDQATMEFGDEEAN